MAMTAAQIFEDLERRGERLFIEDGKLVMTPGKIDDEFFEIVKAHRVELKEMTLLREMRRFFPGYGKQVTCPNGDKCTVVGASPEGLLVRSEVGMPSHWISFKELEGK